MPGNFVGAVRFQNLIRPKISCLAMALGTEADLRYRQKGSGVEYVCVLIVFNDCFHVRAAWAVTTFALDAKHGSIKV